MNLLAKTKEICSQNNINPVRSRGQNFLINPEIYEKIVKTADLSKEDQVLEVGPGLGFLTEALAREALFVRAVEIDSKLACFLKEKFRDRENIEIIEKNVLDIDSDDLEKNYKIVANLPYNITSVFLRKFLSGQNKPEDMTLMIQKEVAERICAEAGSMSLLALSVQYYGEPKMEFAVGPSNFWPEPEVDSAVIKIKIKKNTALPVEKERDFFRMLKFGFASKRKMLKNNLASGYHAKQEDMARILESQGFNPKTRAQELSLDNWLVLFKALSRYF